LFLVLGIAKYPAANSTGAGTDCGTFKPAATLMSNNSTNGCAEQAASNGSTLGICCATGASAKAEGEADCGTDHRNFFNHHFISPDCVRMFVSC
jgi:hypothetical protein